MQAYVVYGIVFIWIWDVAGRIPHAVVCPPTNTSCDTSSLWTGPIFANASVSMPSISAADIGIAPFGAAETAVVLDYKPFTTEGLALKDVEGTNPDGTSNNCSIKAVGQPSCCAGLPPFELLAANGSWVRVPRSHVVIAGSTVRLTSVAAAAASQVRYAWSDFVDCVLVNADGLVASPFLVNISKAAAPTDAVVGATAAPKRLNDAKKGLIQSPPLGTNTWNFYHCNIDENIVKRLANSFVSNGMAKAGYQYVICHTSCLSHATCHEKWFPHIMISAVSTLCFHAPFFVLGTSRTIHQK
jgi:hypothetical protein